LYCNPDTAKKITFSLLLVSLAVQAVKDIIWFHADVNRSIITVHIYLTILNIVLPLTLLVMNMTVVCKVRRRTHNAAVDVGHQQSLQRHQQHQQPTSSSFTMPTILLITTSLIYVLLCGTWFTIYYVYWWTQSAALSSATRVDLLRVYLVAEEAHCFVFSCAFYVYLLRGKRFRSDLHKLFCRRCIASDEH